MLGRPKGSKNKKTIDLEQLQQRVYELEKVKNSYSEVLDAFVEGFVMDLFNKDIIKRIDNSTLQTWFSNPDDYMKNITTLLTYYYIIDGNIFQLFDLIFTLPPLDYKIDVLQKDDQTPNDLKLIKLYLERKINHKELTRDLLVQLASKGTVIGTWLGNKKEPYFYTFDDLEYVYPYGRYKGKMTAVVDLKWLDNKSEEEREIIFNNLSPIITQQKYQAYKNNNKPENEKKLRYIMLPIEKTLVARIHTLSRNQRLGIPFGTQAIFDMQHKQKLKDLETAIANKIIRAIAVLHFKGKDDNGIKVTPEDKRKVFNGVKKALEKNASQNGITCIAIPDFAEFDMPDIKNAEQTLSPDKYESINNDISTATGVSPTLNNGTKGNYASGALNLSIIYKKIGVLLEKISPIYNLLIDFIFGERGENYLFSYNTEEPLSPKEKLASLHKLQAQGYSTKAVLDRIGIDADEYFEQSIYEIEDLKLREKIIPPKTTYTMSDNGGRPSSGNTDDNDSNSHPSPSDE